MSISLSSFDNSLCILFKADSNCFTSSSILKSLASASASSIALVTSLICCCKFHHSVEQSGILLLLISTYSSNAFFTFSKDSIWELYLFLADSSSLLLDLDCKLSICFAIESNFSW